MKKVQLIVTGQLEYKELAGALERVMLGEPAAPPRVTNARAAEIGEPACKPPDAGRRSNTQMFMLAAEVVKLMLGRGVVPIPEDTMLLIIGDVEMYYLERPEELLIGFEESVEEVLADLSEAEQNDVKATLRARCSYHLFRPMVEATFFGDDQALKVAGVIRLQQPLEDLISCRDVEEFESVDPLWAPECKEKNRKKVAEGKEWWRHERHAKEYLTHLASSKRGGLGYSTNRGFKALRTLHFPTVVNTQPSPYLRALFDDLADWLGVPNPLGPTDPALPRPPTALCADPGRLLRNILAASAAPTSP